MTAVTSPPPKTAIPLPMERIAEFCRKWRVVDLTLFGSVLRDDFRPESDVDVMVSFELTARPSLFTIAEMQDELESIFGRKVDLLTRRGVEGMMNPDRRSEILRTARVAYAR